MTSIPVLVNGNTVETSLKYEVLSPTGEVLYSSSYVSVKELDQICESSLEGFELWRDTPLAARVAILRKAVAALRLREPEFKSLMIRHGLPEYFAQFNAVELANQLDSYIDQMQLPYGEVVHSEGTELALTVTEPIGPVLAIAPWNAPGVLTGRTVSAPLAAGCSVVLKTSELASEIGYLFVKCLHEAGVPPKTVQLINVHADDNKAVIQKLIENQSIRKVSFTGSTSTGASIASVAAKNLKPCLLELGGKNCTIIDENADLKAAVLMSLWSSWANMGQVCMCTDKLFVHKAIYDEFISEVKKVASSITQTEEYKLPQRTIQGALKIQSLVNDAVEKGAELVFGQVSQIRTENTPISPILLGNVSPEMDIDSQEIFGPVACVYTFTDPHALVKQLNREPYGLKASIWSKDILKAQKLARRLETGGVHINSPTIFDEATLPHGGVKDSGSGRFNSKWGISEFSYVKVITMN